MINLSLGRHDFLNAVEGFARGSHLRQHVWQEIVYKSIPQMSDDDMDFLWFYMRRDIFECYFYELNGKKNTYFGYEDFMHALAALHRGNRYMVTFYNEIEHKQLQALCYRFDGEYHPLYLYIDGKVLASMFDPRKFMCKITPLHRTNSCEANHIQTSGGYDSFVPYKNVEEDLKANGFDVIVFVPSYDEDNGLITCGNAILSGKKPTSSYKEVVF